MKTIWKTTLNPFSTHVSLPEGAQHLSVKVQKGEVVLYSLVDPVERKVVTSLYILGTGHDVPEDVGKFIGTFMLDEGDLVFHVFDVDE